MEIDIIYEIIYEIETESSPEEEKRARVESILDKILPAYWRDEKLWAFRPVHMCLRRQDWRGAIGNAFACLATCQENRERNMALNQYMIDRGTDSNWGKAENPWDESY